MVMVGPSDRGDPVGTLPQTVRRDFSAVDYGEAVRRARQIVPILRERAQQAEDARMLIRENEQLLHESGLFRFHQPKAFGGMELDFVAVVDVPAELARGCPSTAWNVGNVACHHWILGYYDPETQREVWDANPDAVIASSIALAAGRGRKAEGGFIVNGRWPFSSAVDNSEWNMLAVSIYDDDGKPPVDWRLCLVPKSDYEIIDTWYAMGMVGTGSKDIAVAELFVPERRALPLLRCRGGLEHPGADLTNGPLYRIPVVAASSHPLAPAAVGAAEGAYELFIEAMARRVGTYTGARVADFQAVQIKVGRARCLIDSARHLLRQSAIEFQAIAERNEAPDLQTKLRFRAHSAFAVSQSREAVEILWSCYGAQGL
jgi:3-hydroxy-9,10-secoandrosta-1,3,5(10)-triene-9,17-dione monooxygenase